MVVVRQQRKTYDYALSRRAFGSGGLCTSYFGRLRHVVVLAKSSTKRGSRIKRAALSAYVLGSSLRSDPQESGSACSPQLWVVAMLKQLFQMYWVESAGGLL